MCCYQLKLKKNLDFSPHANYTNRATAGEVNANFQLVHKKLTKS
jgi:hypothetical protein